MTLFRCLACESDLPTDFVCSDCGVSYPVLDGVPVLLSDAEAAVQRFRLRLREFAEGVEQGIKTARIELDRPDLLPRTRERIERSCSALSANQQLVLDLLSDAGLSPAPPDEGELHSDGVASVAGHGSITEYYDLIHRDWGWPDHDEENHIACERVLEVVEERPEVIVVLGAGAGRLAYDVHHALNPTATIALDINPLHVLVAARLARGQTLSLTEFPLIPRDFDHTHVPRELRAPHGAVDRFFAVVADAFDAPIASGAADLVITPWFIDQVPADARDAIGVAHRLLRPGGRWINHGPLIYPKDRAYGVRFTAVELLELMDIGGFEVTSKRSDMSAFLRSPAAGFARIEQVHTIAANKREAVDDANWLLAPHLPVPRFPGLDSYEAPHPLLGNVAAMIDGKTSLAVITARVVREHGIPPQVAKLGVPAAAAEIARATSSVKSAQ